jgi:hypothetical protein
VGVEETVTNMECIARRNSLQSFIESLEIAKAALNQELFAGTHEWLEAHISYLIEDTDNIIIQAEYILTDKYISEGTTITGEYPV